MTSQERYRETNRSLWDGWTRLHRQSDFYDVEGFLAGQTSLQPIEQEALGDVAGQTLLHLQCHFGLDTLSWARLGAQVTGVDLSPAAIDEARRLAEQAGLEARFIASDLYALPDVLDETFDLVFTSYGVLCWLPDLNGWAALVARYLRPGGLFFLVEFHPLLDLLADDGQTLAHTYFGGPAPERFLEEGSYAAPEADFTHEAFVWRYTLGEVVTALAGAGLRIEALREFPFSVYNCYPFLEEQASGRYVAAGQGAKLPHLFSVRATK